MSGITKDVAVAAGAADVTYEVLVVAVVVVGTAVAVTVGLWLLWLRLL